MFLHNLPNNIFVSQYSQAQQPFQLREQFISSNAEVYMVLVKTSNCMRKFYSLQGLFITAELFTARNEVGAR